MFCDNTCTGSIQLDGWWGITYPHFRRTGLWRLSLNRLGLEGKHDNRPSQLSGGQQQRVSIARAVAKNPELLFADEPTANLDGASSDDVIEALRKLHSEGQTILMVTHEHEYTQFCNRVLWMEDGVITKELDPYKK